MDYARLKSSADRMIVNAKQGTIEIGASVSVAGATPLAPPTVTTTWASYDGVARGVSAKYVDGQTILATDLMVILEADATPAVGKLMRIDGVIRNIVRVDNIPAAGLTVAKRVFIR